MPLRLGVLLPDSTFIPRFGKGYLHALKSGFARQGMAPDLAIAHCGYNANTDELIRAAAKLVVEQDVHAVVAPLNPRMAGRIGAPFIHNGVPLIAHHLGEDLLAFEDRFDGLFLHGGNAWLCQWMSGHWAGSHLGPRGVSFAALHDGGYAMQSAFAKGFQAAGGTLIGSRVTHSQRWHEDCSPLLDEACGETPDLLVGLYSGRTATSFLSHFDEGTRHGIPLIANHGMLTPEVLSEVGQQALGIHSVALWDLGDEPPETGDFVADFKRTIGRSPDGHALMAFESALMLGAAAKGFGNTEFTPEALRGSLIQTQVIGPRGAIRVDAGEITPATTTCALFRVEKNGAGQIDNLRVRNLEIPEGYQAAYAAARDNPLKGGWLNPYLVG